MITNERMRLGENWPRGLEGRGGCAACAALSRTSGAVGAAGGRDLKKLHILCDPVLLCPAGEVQLCLTDGQVSLVYDLADDKHAIDIVEVDKVGLAVFDFVDRRGFRRIELEVCEFLVRVQRPDIERFGIQSDVVVELEFCWDTEFASS